MAKAAAAGRLRKELSKIMRNPPEYMCASPAEENILKWYYLISLPEDHDSPYAGGVYAGRLLFPASYPLKPPGVIMDTPSGRFDPGKRICLSMSDFVSCPALACTSVPACSHPVP